MSRSLEVTLIEPVGAHGGMHHYDLGLAGGLAAVGVSVALHTSSIGDLRPPCDVEVHPTFRGSFGSLPRPLRAVLYAWALERSLRSARRAGTDLLHLHAFGGTRLERYTLGRSRTTGLPVALTAHDIRSLGGEDPGRRLAEYYGRADALIVHNRASRRALNSIDPALTPHEVPHGHYLDTYGEPPPRTEARRRLGIERTAFLLLFFGQIKPAKGLDLLLRALPLVRAKHPECRLLIAGRAWRDRPESYHHLVQDLDLEKIVDFRPGFVDDSDVPTMFAAADLVVLPYRRVYQSGVALLAMSHGRTVLASDLPALTETVRDGRTGFLFRRGDAEHLAERLSELAERRPELDETGRRGRAWVRRHHDWRTIGERTLAVYRGLLD